MEEERKIEINIVDNELNEEICDDAIAMLAVVAGKSASHAACVLTRIIDFFDEQYGIDLRSSVASYNECEEK